MVSSGATSFEERVGRVLLDAEFVTDEQLETARETGREGGEGLLDTLVSLGIVARETLMTVLSFQLRIPVVDLKSVQVDPEAVALVPEDFARQHNILPTGFEADGSLRIATTGLKVAPPLFQTIEVLGKERTLRSIERALDKLSS